MITPDKEKYSWKTPVTVSCIFALICLPGLTVPLHGDEAITYLEHIVSTPWQLLFQYVGPNQHTLFSILSNTSMRILGEYEVVFRLPVFLAAALSIFLIHRLGQSLWNGTAAMIASLLMMGSYHHLYWAQHGRGYALTELLALSSVLGMILLLNKKSNRGTLILIFSGFALCLAQPSNAYFLPGCGLAVLFVLWESKNSESPVSWFLLGEKLFPFLILIVLTAGYFFMIYDDLVWGIETYKTFLNQTKSADSVTGFSQFYKIFQDLARPWGLLFYLPVLYGVWTLNRAQRGFFLILLGTPVLLVVLSGMVGPPRVYVYVLPFLILLAAIGIDRGIDFLSLSISTYFKKVLSAILFFMFLIPSVLNHSQNYLDTREIKYATMKESREALRYLQNQISKHDLLVIPIDDMALRRTLEPLVAEKMLHVFKDGQLDRIIFLGHRDIPATRIASVAKVLPSALPDSLMQDIAEIGKVRMYRMNVKVSPFLPLEADMNFSQRWGKFRNPKISETETHEHRFLGQKSLQINKTIQEDALIYSPFTNSISSGGGSFILYGYAGKYRQKSKAGLLVKENQGAFSLNHLFGVYREEKNALVREWIHPFFFFRHSKHQEHFKWQIIFMLFPLKAGLNEIQKSFFLRDQVSYFDGFQGYLLTPMQEDF